MEIYILQKAKNMVKLSTIYTQLGICLKSLMRTNINFYKEQFSVVNVFFSTTCNLSLTVKPPNCSHLWGRVNLGDKRDSLFRVS